MTTGAREWVDYDTAPLRQEWRLFRSSFRKGRFERQASGASAWPSRCDAWEVHATAWARLKGAEQAGVAQNTRIAFLFDHLNVLDTKLGMLLNFNSILLISFNVMVGLIINFTQTRGQTSATHTVAGQLFAFHPATMWVFVIASAWFAVCWFVATLLGLVGGRRLVWGDLGLIHEAAAPRHLTLEELGDQELLRRAEQEHVQSLIVAVVKRSNKFRIAVALTIGGAVGLSVAIVTGSILLWTSNV